MGSCLEPVRVRCSKYQLLLLRETTDAGSVWRGEGGQKNKQTKTGDTTGPLMLKVMGHNS